MGLAAKFGHMRTRTGPKDPALRKARVCYNHLAGELGVRLYDSLVQQGAVIEAFPEVGVSAEKLPEAVLRALQGVTAEVLEEEAEGNPIFKEILDSQRAFRHEYAAWSKRAYLPRNF